MPAFWIDTIFTTDNAFDIWYIDEKNTDRGTQYEKVNDEEMIYPLSKRDTSLMILVRIEKYGVRWCVFV
ncbi:MAG: hypothetical protein JXN65_01520 [Clostridia bacterium]|nr:hypothetical protein [Clostridia bacterium]